MRFPSLKDSLPGQETLGLLFVLILSFFTVFYGYQNPPHFFWDENYHVASAQKYLNGVYFMEPHPPLGKMLIALGEKFINANAADNQFIGTDYGQSPPEGFSFAGFRFFPTLLGWLTAPLFYLIFLTLTRRPLWAVLLSFLYLFDNALIVHVRGAMLEGPLLFFSALTILSFLRLLEHRDDPGGFSRAALLFGFAFSAAMLTKVFSLIFILFVPALFLLIGLDRRRILRFLGWSALGFLPFYILVWQLHFSIGRTINPSLPDQGYYQASEPYKKLLTAGRTRSLLSFPVMLRDSLNFIPHYEAGVPRLDLCKDNENGSPWFLWPFGGRSINYRWETPNGQAFRYLYLQVNPVIWLLGLLGVLLAALHIVARFLAPPREDVERFGLLLTFFVLYASFLWTVSRIDRVMYLYHYFIPLFASFILFSIIFLELRTIGRWRLTETMRTTMLLMLGLLMFVSYQFYRPLTYYEAITDEQMQRRALLQIWELKCVHCPHDSPFVIIPEAPNT